MLVMAYTDKARHQAYNRWWAMIQRCTSPKHHRWNRYGGRGITVCDEWLDFDAYYAATGDRPEPDLTIDRINNDGNYEPGNWRWATRAEQRANSRDHQREKTHCPRGHEYDITEVAGRVHRGCRRCVREAWAAKKSRGPLVGQTVGVDQG